MRIAVASIAQTAGFKVFGEIRGSYYDMNCTHVDDVTLNGSIGIRIPSVDDLCMLL